MKNFINLKKFMRYAGIFLLVTGLIGCSDDEDIELLTGTIQISPHNTLSGNVLNVPSITVGQASWLAAVLDGEENSNNFIAQPVMVKKGTTPNVKLVFDDAVVDYKIHQAQVVLKLYSENQTGGIRGEWDISDKPILRPNNELVIRKITILVDLTDYSPFRHLFDENGDGTLDSAEVSKTYPNKFRGFWDTDEDGQLDFDEFYRTTFLHADVNWDGGISVDDWNAGYSRMFRIWSGENFSSFDIDKNNFLNWEEWIKIFENSDWFETYDANSDNFISEAELNEGFFSDWDLNKDDKIDEDEFNNYQPYVIYWEYEYWF